MRHSQLHIRPRFIAVICFIGAALGVFGLVIEFSAKTIFAFCTALFWAMYFWTLDARRAASARTP